MLDSPESATLAVTIIPVSRVGGVATPGPLVISDTESETVGEAAAAAQGATGSGSSS